MRAAGDVVCPRCRDSGYVGSPLIRNATGPLAWRLAGVPVGEIPWCDCESGRSWRAYYAAGMRQAHQERIEATFQRAGIPARFEGLGFDTIPPEHRKGKEQAIAAARQFATQGYVLRPDGKRRPGLALIGRPGVGKTGILSVAFRERLAAGAAGLWIELYAFFGEIQGEYGKEGGDADGKLRAAQRAEVALLDDCGDPDRAKVNPATGEPAIQAETDDRRRILWEIVDYRHGHELPTLVTSNLSRGDFEAQWGSRLAARLWELCWIVPVMGQDLRQIPF
jgi:hypothetical protein